MVQIKKKQSEFHQQKEISSQRWTTTLNFIICEIILIITLKMTPAKVFETSITTADNSPSQDYTHPNDQTILLQ